MNHSIPVEHLHTSYGEKGQSMVLSPLASKQIRIYQVKLLNRSNNLCDVGILRKLADEQRKIFYYDGAVVSEITSAINASTPSIVFDVAANTALIVQARRKFNLIGIIVSTVETGTPVYEGQYFNGTAFVPLPDIIQTINLVNLGYSLLVFSSPLDQEVGGEPGTDQSLYTIKIVATTAPTNAPEITSVQVASMIDFSPGVNINSGMEDSWSVDYPFHLEANEGLIPFFSNPSDLNLVTAFYSQDN